MPPVMSNNVQAMQKCLLTIKPVLTLSGLLLSCLLPCLAETLSLENAIGIALDRNPAVKALQARLDVSDAEIQTAGARLNPALVSDNGIAEKTYRLGIEQTFELGGKRKRRIELARLNRNVVDGEVRKAVLNIRTDVRKAFTQLYSAQQRQLALREILLTTGKLLLVAEQREKAGDISQLDVLQAEVAMVNAKNDFLTAQAHVVQAKNALNTLLYSPLESDVQLDAPTTVPVGLNTITQSSLIETGLNQRPELYQNQQSLLAADKQKAIARANRVPNLSLTAGPDLVAGSDRSLNAFIVGNMQLPLFNRQQGPIQEALARRKQLLLEQEALKNTIRLEISNAFNQFVASQQRVERYEADLIPMAKRVSDKSRRSFEVGKTALLISLNAQQAFINTKLGYLQSLQDLQNAVSDLERAVGVGL